MFTIGADPELFVTRNGKIVPCVELIEGTKEEHFMLDGDVFIHEDNVLLEFGVTPSINRAEFSHKMMKALMTVKEYLTQLGLSYSFDTTHIFEAWELESGQAKQFGCEPDINAYTYTLNRPPKSDILMRSSAGHVHIGSFLTNEEVVALARMLDVFLSLDMLMLEPNSGRREIYGFAGSYRKKIYGLEYRTPSNFWIFDRSYIEAIYDKVELSLKLVKSGFRVMAKDFSKINMAINTHNIGLAEELHKNYMEKISSLELCEVQS